MKPRILVVDDEAAISDLVSHYFRQQGYDTATASSAAETQQLIAANPYDLVILDIDLRGADGLELLGIIKQAHPRIAVIMFTGLGFDESLLQKALQNGASGYASKTLPLDHLLIEVLRTLELQRQRR